MKVPKNDKKVKKIRKPLVKDLRNRRGNLGYLKDAILTFKFFVFFPIAMLFISVIIWLATGGNWLVEIFTTLAAMLMWGFVYLLAWAVLEHLKAIQEEQKEIPDIPNGK